MASTRPKQVMDSIDVNRSVTRLAHEILERNGGADQLMLVGILTRGEPLAKRLQSLIQKIAEEKSINVSNEELTNGLVEYASQYPGQEKQIFDYFKKTPSSVESIRGPIFEQKIVDHILSKVKLKNEKINVNKFEKLQEETFNNKEI